MKILALFAFAVCLIFEPLQAQERPSFRSSWAQIMFDLETVIRAHAKTGPYISGQPEDFGKIEAEDMVLSKFQKSSYEGTEAFQHFKDERKMYAWGELSSKYQFDVESSVLKEVLWEQFEISFARELRKLNPNEAGLLMAHFSTIYNFKAPTFMSPLVYFAWGYDAEFFPRITRMAQEMIWESGNPAAIREFIPRLLTNRLGSFANMDGLRQRIYKSHTPLPSSSLKGWRDRYPTETEMALEHFKTETVSGSLRQPEFLKLPGEDILIWASTALLEASESVGYALSEKTCSTLFK